MQLELRIAVLVRECMHGNGGRVRLMNGGYNNSRGVHRTWPGELTALDWRSALAMQDGIPRAA